MSRAAFERYVGRDGTPTPWRFDKDASEIQGGADFATCIALIVDASDRYEGGLDKPSYGESAVNGAVIAVAAELLEALREACAELESWTDPGDYDETTIKCRALITRAEGRHP